MKMNNYPGNGIYIVQGEIQALMASMRRIHWSSKSYQEEESKPLVKKLAELKSILSQIIDLNEIETETFLEPFLEVIRSNETTVQVTTMALSSVGKFITYGLIRAENEKSLFPLVENVAIAVAHANFVDHPSDVVVLMKIVEVLRQLMLSHLGLLLPNDSICEIMLSLFKICFEVRLNELLRNSAEHCLKDIVQLLFSRLPLFTESSSETANHKKMRIRSTSVDNEEVKIKKSEEKMESPVLDNEKEAVNCEESVNSEIKDDEISIPAVTEDNDECEDKDLKMEKLDVEEKMENRVEEKKLVNEEYDKEINKENSNVSEEKEDEEVHNTKLVNSQGVRFMPKNPELADQIPLEPYNVICIQELLRFLSLICNPYDKQNTEIMICSALSLLTVAFEVGAESIYKHAALMAIVKDTLCRNLFSLLKTERLSVFASDLHVLFLIFQSMRHDMKFQLEYFFTHLYDFITTDTSKVNYGKKELALESLVHLWRIPGLVTELFLNYDCDVYCPNLYEEITKLLSNNVYPTTGEIYSTNLLSLDALLAVVDSIEKHCHSRISSEKTESDKGEEITTDRLEDVVNGIDVNAPNHEQIMAIKRKKKLIATGTEHFNANPKKGIEFLQEQRLLSTPLDPLEVATFLRENPHLDKKTIGEYISRRSNLQTLEAFAGSFDFSGMRIDDALRLYLESFRLPGESPLISLVMQHFADYYQKCNNEPFAKPDAAYILAYAIIMLNVDQHNKVVKRQINPMTLEGFKKNLKGVNGGNDFDDDLLDQIYYSIKNEEIVMPAEHTGLILENYLWKVLLRRGAGKNSVYIGAKDGLYDHELFSICWTPVISALSYVFDRATDSAVSYKAIQGFRKCATISAHYAMTNEYDHLTLSLCKFTMLLNPTDNFDSFTISFGMNSKARLAARTLFSLVHRYGDLLREGWRPVFDCIFQLFRCKLLPKILVEAEDFLELSGKVSIVREESPSQKTNNDNSLLSSLYSYITAATEASSQKILSEEEQEHIEIAKNCILDCHLENLILESKFLRLESLHELITVLIKECYANDDGTLCITNKHDEDKAIFFLELLLKVVIQNRDRVVTLWPIVCEHIASILSSAAETEQHFLVERCVIGLLRLAIRLMRREEISSLVLQSLEMLISLKWSSLLPVCRQISYGLHELLKTGAANIHSESDWAIIFTLLQVVGAGAPTSKTLNTREIVDGVSSDEGLAEDSGLGYDKRCISSSDSSLNVVASDAMSSSPSSTYIQADGEAVEISRKMWYTNNQLLPHDAFSLVKCCESLAFLIRDVAHITPFNFENCIYCLRTFVEATLYEGERKSMKKKSSSNPSGKSRGSKKHVKTTKSSNNSNTSAYDADESDTEGYPDSYFQAPLQLLDLVHTLHTRTAHIFRWWAEECNSITVDSGTMWDTAWCPLLQTIARLCCDTRKPVRMSSISYLQRALLMHDLQTLSGREWSLCFNKVLFPLLFKLSKVNHRAADNAALEEIRMRAATLLSKVFLHHLTPLHSLPTFTSLWLKILDFMDIYMNIDKSSDLLNEAIQESVKNMLLVMESAKLFSTEEQSSPFWQVTWDRINKFLPHLKDELHKYHSPVKEDNAMITEDEKEDKPSNGENMEIGRKLEEKPHSSLMMNPVTVDLPYMAQLVSTPIGPMKSEEPNIQQPEISSLLSSPSDIRLPCLRAYSSSEYENPNSTSIPLANLQNPIYQGSQSSYNFPVSPEYLQDKYTSFPYGSAFIPDNKTVVESVDSAGQSDTTYHETCISTKLQSSPIITSCLPVYSGFSQMNPHYNVSSTNTTDVTSTFFFQS